MGDKYPAFGSTSGLYGNRLNRAPSVIGNEEPVVIIGDNSRLALWAGVKYVYSGGSGGIGASGFMYWSGESDIEPPNISGWGQVRIPQLNTVHWLQLNPRFSLRAWVDYPASGVGGISGNVALVRWQELMTGYISGNCMLSGENSTMSGGIYFASGLWVSGAVEIMAIGTK